jgi:hypothetical protein
VRPPPAGGDLGAQRALAAGLDGTVRRLAEDREVGGEPVAVVALDASEAVARGLDLLAVVEDEGEVVARVRQGGSEVGEHGVARLHVRGAAAVQPRTVAPAGHVVGDRHGVDVPGQQHAPLPAHVGARQHGIAGSQHLQVRGLRPQGVLQRGGERPLVTGHAGHVDERGTEVDGIGKEIKRRHGGNATGPAPPARRIGTRWLAVSVAV